MAGARFIVRNAWKRWVMLLNTFIDGLMLRLETIFLGWVIGKLDIIRKVLNKSGNYGEMKQLRQQNST